MLQATRPQNWPCRTSFKVNFCVSRSRVSCLPARSWSFVPQPHRQSRPGPVRSGPGASLAAMRIRKGPRCVPLAATDRCGLQIKGFLYGAENARREDGDEKKRLGVNQAGGGGPVAAATSHGSQDVKLANGTSSAGAERLEDDPVRKRLSADGRFRTRPPIAEGVISISSIIQAGVRSARRDPASAPASAQSVVTSVDASPAKSRTDCNPSIAEKTLDQPNLLLQSLKIVCSAAEHTGLTAKEAVARILDQGLPGLIEGGERLIVQVAKLFRSSSAFTEREERGRYFIHDMFQALHGWDRFQTGDSPIKREQAVHPNGSPAEAEKAIGAARQSIELEPVPETAAFTRRVGKSGTGRWVVALRRGKSAGKASTSQPTSPPRDEDPDLQCNRDDGKGWRCVRHAELGFSLCTYHREQIRRAEVRRRKTRSKSKKRSHAPMPSSPVSPVQPEKPASNPTHALDDVKAVNAPEAGKTVDVNSIVSDNELPDHKRRRFARAKSLKSIL